MWLGKRKVKLSFQLVLSGSQEGVEENRNTKTSIMDRRKVGVWIGLERKGNYPPFRHVIMIIIMSPIQK
tara:strand:+ start:697 stop:903 length:207 start_codon:yes stop_codon:yes gene_type:complete